MHLIIATASVSWSVGELKDLAPREFVSRSIGQEIKEGRGRSNKDYVLLKIDHRRRDDYEALPLIRETR